MIISISGVPGSGKSSTAKILAEKLGMTMYSMGGLRGKMALERGITIDELNKIGETDHTTDTQVDDYQRELGKTEDTFVIEGRLSWHFIPQSFKIFLDCDPRVAAERIYGSRNLQDRQDEPMYASIEQAQTEIANRVASDIRRYDTIYQVDYRNPSNFDLVLDTTTNPGPEATADAIIAELKKRGRLKQT
jgi:cytidylate kinase